MPVANTLKVPFPRASLPDLPLKIDEAVIGIMLPHLIGAIAHNTCMELVQGNHTEISIFSQRIVS